ncbi:MAG: hypothetical protein R6T99_04950 [Bacteroidales bacterium]
MNRQQRITGLICVLITSPFADLTGQNLKYTEKKGEEKYHYHYYYSREDPGWKVRCVKLDQKKDTLEDQTLLTGASYRSRRWDYHRPTDNTRVTARLKNNEVLLEGIHEGEALTRSFDIEDGPWLQVFPMNPGLETWLKGSEETMRFYVIGTASKADMDINLFVAEKEEELQVGVPAGNFEAWKVNITLSGWRSMFWDGNFFFRKKDMRIIKYDGGGAPGEPGSLTRLVSEKK